MVKGIMVNACCAEGIMFKEKDSVTHERNFAKHARVDLINLLDIWGIKALTDLNRDR